MSGWLGALVGMLLVFACRAQAPVAATGVRAPTDSTARAESPESRADAPARPLDAPWVRQRTMVGGCAVVDGSVWCQRLPRGLSDHVLPVRDGLFHQRVSEIRDATAIACGTRHCCTLGEDGSVTCFGANDRGQMGNPHAPRAILPHRVPLRGSAAGVFAGGDTSCALVAEGLVCWGAMAPFAGMREQPPSPVPLRVFASVDVVDVALQSTGGCVLKTAGTLACWPTRYGKAARVEVPVDLEDPEPVETEGRVTSVSAVAFDTFYTTDDGRLQVLKPSSSVPPRFAGLASAEEVVTFWRPRRYGGQTGVVVRIGDRIIGTIDGHEFDRRVEGLTEVALFADGRICSRQGRALHCTIEDRPVGEPSVPTADEVESTATAAAKPGKGNVDLPPGVRTCRKKKSNIRPSAPPVRCGNGTLEDGEACDGRAEAIGSCEEAGLEGGRLGCHWCFADTLGCGACKAGMRCAATEIADAGGLPARPALAARSSGAALAWVRNGETLSGGCRVVEFAPIGDDMRIGTPHALDAVAFNRSLALTGTGAGWMAAYDDGSGGTAVRALAPDGEPTGAAHEAPVIGILQLVGGRVGEPSLLIAHPIKGSKLPVQAMLLAEDGRPIGEPIAMWSGGYRLWGALAMPASRTSAGFAVARIEPGFDGDPAVSIVQIPRDGSSVQRALLPAGSEASLLAIDRTSRGWRARVLDDGKLIDITAQGRTEVAKVPIVGRGRRFVQQLAHAGTKTAIALRREGQPNSLELLFIDDAGVRAYEEVRNDPLAGDPTVAILRDTPLTSWIAPRLRGAATRGGRPSAAPASSTLIQVARPRGTLAR